MSREFEEILAVVENALVYRDGKHQAGASVSPDACVACRGGRRHDAMRKISNELFLRGIDVSHLAWKVNRVCPGADARVSPEGVLLINQCAVSTVVLADLVSGARRCAQEVGDELPRL